jgi:hypothetical protein
VRAQKRRKLFFDVRDPAYRVDQELLGVATPWMERVVGPYKARRNSQG